MTVQDDVMRDVSLKFKWRSCTRLLNTSLQTLVWQKFPHCRRTVKNICFNSRTVVARNSGLAASER